MKNNITLALTRLSKNNSSLTRARLAESVGISLGGVKYHLGHIRKQGIIKREGSTKKGKWIVLDRA